ncbi:guanylate kinase [Mesomycoplasma hyorhinis]|uniref:Guanylate kinase n=3 Tax=Mesomycoplasma hyorhinis TaxID=2100 RepID=A0AAI8AN21_MESHY|nr:guanylate kinase [Mesomycoplasma hyorhinis]AEC46297.1 Guanylate kinase Gmk [Mesomycoplasma hyorhinis MCLD]AEX14207.1 guanylate kinase [Mesomycoplasma hyorhinis GDL-1]AFX74397.1 Guanylate kinase [Mesomycoplasma hyorhinis SK76]AHA41207.1 guanylate kinase [Mesomycoplasma hyorhinis DBS 1050]AOD25443.1 Guanylate kinase Gmk [Mesomycoplasma hyorhinis]
MAKLIVLIGPSGVGKGSIEEILFQNPNLKIKLSVSATTRDKRPNEVDGKNYYFISKEDFKNKIKNNEFLEWNKHFNNYYGTLKSEVDNIIKEGYSPILEIETVGALNIMKMYEQANKSDQLVTIFIAPPTFDDLKKRIISRKTDSHEQIQLRIDKSLEELSQQHKFQYIVVNKDLKVAAKEVEKIILKEDKN